MKGRNRKHYQVRGAWCPWQLGCHPPWDFSRSACCGPERPAPPRTWHSPSCYRLLSQTPPPPFIKGSLKIHKHEPRTPAPARCYRHGGQRAHHQRALDHRATLPKRRHPCFYSTYKILGPRDLNLKQKQKIIITQVSLSQEGKENRVS